MTNPPPSPRRPWRTREEWHRLHERIDAARMAGVHRSRRRPLAWLAAAVLVVAAAGLTWRFTTPRAPELRVATTAAGEHMVLRFADSSVVTLGPASTIRYVIDERRREVELRGLADFKVVHETARPFVVRAKNAVATDLGTAFVVRAYSEDSTVQVAVTSGVVSFGGVGSTPIELRQGDVARVDARGVATREAVAASSRAAWIDGGLVFTDEPLASVARELSRWFDVTIQIPDSTLARRRVSAVYNSPTLAGVLDALEASLDVHVAHSGRSVVITARTR